ncbi:MAG: hypothetical protein FJZ16_05930, partial [Candidatus Omnitrophica bacterium]|nr:hypothetical protein [Candidatus Omnitrophota bacterium]
MNNRLLYTYALTKTIFEQRKDYLDTFCPFVLKVLPSDGSVLTISSVQENIKNTYGLKIPEHSLKSILTRAKDLDYLNIEKWKSKLCEKGIKYLERLEPERDVDRRINELLGDIGSYLNEKNLSRDEVYKIVLCFINENIDQVIELFDPSRTCDIRISKSKFRVYETKLIQYFVDAEKQKPNFWKTLQDIVYGSVLSVSATSSNIAEMNKKFKDIEIFLDSNFIFSLFEFHFPEMNKPAKELYELLRLYKFELKIFDFTVHEIVDVLNNYPKEQHMYVPGIKVNSIYSNLKS